MNCLKIAREPISNNKYLLITGQLTSCSHSVDLFNMKLHMATEISIYKASLFNHMKLHEDRIK